MRSADSTHAGLYSSTAHDKRMQTATRLGDHGRERPTSSMQRQKEKTRITSSTSKSLKAASILSSLRDAKRGSKKGSSTPHVRRGKQGSTPSVLNTGTQRS